MNSLIQAHGDISQRLDHAYSKATILCLLTEPEWEASRPRIADSALCRQIRELTEEIDAIRALHLRVVMRQFSLSGTVS